MHWFEMDAREATAGAPLHHPALLQQKQAGRAAGAPSVEALAPDEEMAGRRRVKELDGEGAEEADGFVRPSPQEKASGPPAASGAPPAPVIIKADPRPAGWVGQLQSLGAHTFLLLLGSSFYLCLAAAVYIVVGFLAGHVFFPTILAGIWIGQALAPLPRYKQWPEAMRQHWLFRELALYFDMTLVLEQR
jgi:hypothetical protein